ncbi:MAG: hypothetical protein PHS14_00900 [Elusimicrobia bacterium]|nr:hypothetical protein [Elusimicrobiota bacterium]
MPLEPFQGETFVAFIDIIGFKAMMREDGGRRAIIALDDFYSVGYNVLRAQQAGRPAIEGLFVSDCGILFARGNDVRPDEILKQILTIIENIHRRCSERAVFLTSSIAWGTFSYHQRIEFQGIEKNPVFGNAYISAFMDNAEGKPKIYSGDCRIIRDNLPEEAAAYCKNHADGISERIRAAPKHYYYEWTRPRRG